MEKYRTGLVAIGFLVVLTLNRERGGAGGAKEGGVVSFCDLSFDGLGMSCGRCGSWRRGEIAPDCPPYVTRHEPNGERLPHIKTAAENTRLHHEYFASLDPAWK